MFHMEGEESFIFANMKNMFQHVRTAGQKTDDHRYLKQVPRLQENRGSLTTSTRIMGPW